MRSQGWIERIPPSTARDEYSSNHVAEYQHSRHPRLSPGTEEDMLAEQEIIAGQVAFWTGVVAPLNPPGEMGVPEFNYPARIAETMEELKGLEMALEGDEGDEADEEDEEDEDEEEDEDMEQ